MNKKTKIYKQPIDNPREIPNLFYKGRDTFQNFKKYIIDNICENEKLNYIFVIGDQKYLLENQEDYEEIKKLNETQDGYMDIRDKKINEQFENRKQIHQNQQINQQKENIKEENFETQQLQQNFDDQIKEEISIQDLIETYSTQCKQFFSQNKYLTCPCSTDNQQENCQFCNNQKQIQYEQNKQELDQALQNYLNDNLSKLEQYIKDKLKYDKSETISRKTFYNELMNFENLKRFNFLCIKCKQGFSKESIVYVKQQKFPQSPVCQICYENLNKADQQKYQSLGAYQQSQPHKNMKSINSKGN